MNFLNIIVVLSFLPFDSNPLKVMTIERPGGDIVPYIQYLPANYSKCEKKFPLIIMLHGSGGKGDGSDASMEKCAYGGPPKFVEAGHDMCFKNPSTNETECFAVVAPQAPTTTSSWFPEFTMPLLAHLHSDAYTCLDDNRFFLTGLSMGGRGTFTTLAAKGVHYPNASIRAFAPCCGYLADPDAACDWGNHTWATWIFIGDQDAGYYPKCVLTYEKIQTCSIIEPMITIYPGMNHNIWPQVYQTDNKYHTPNLYEWFLSQSDGSMNKNPVDPVTLFIWTMGITLLFLLIAFNVSIIFYYVYRNKEKIKKEVVRLSKRISRRISFEKKSNFSKIYQIQKEKKLNYPSRPKEKPYKSKYYVKPKNQNYQNILKSNSHLGIPKAKPYKSKFVKPNMKKGQNVIVPPPVNSQIIKKIIKSKYPSQNVQKQQQITKSKYPKVNIQKGQKKKQQFYVSARPKSKYTKELT